MHPILFVLDLGATTRPVASYGVMLAIGMLLGAFASVRAADRAGIAASDALAAAAIVAGSGLAGAFLLQVVVEAARGVPVGEAIARGGLVFYGAPLAGTAALVVATRWLAIPFGRLVDVAIVGVPIAHAMGRIGCFLAGCCYGRPSDLPFAVTFTDPLAAASIQHVGRHPVQLYESALLLVLALVFVLHRPAHVGDGKRALAYAGLYALVRLAMERFRGDVDRGVLGGVVSTSDLISMGVLLAVAGYGLATRRARDKTSPDC